MMISSHLRGTGLIRAYLVLIIAAAVIATAVQHGGFS